MLTRKQHDLLMLIHDRLERDGVPPSFDEMKDQLGLKSKSGIHRLVSALEERGFIKRLPHRARAIEVVRLPDGGRAPGDGRRSPFTPLARATGGTATELALFGRIAAGTPIEALRDPAATVMVPPDMLGPGHHYALEIDGDSMIEDGINDGDIVLIRETEQAEDGSIVVALIDEAEATLKRLKRRPGKVELQPANPAYTPQVFDPDRVRIQGRLVGLMRRY